MRPAQPDAVACPAATGDHLASRLAAGGVALFLTGCPAWGMLGRDIACQQYGIGISSVARLVR